MRLIIDNAKIQTQYELDAKTDRFFFGDLFGDVENSLWLN